MNIIETTVANFIIGENFLGKIKIYLRSIAV